MICSIGPITHQHDVLAYQFYVVSKFNTDLSFCAVIIIIYNKWFDHNYTVLCALPCIGRVGQSGAEHIAYHYLTEAAKFAASYRRALAAICVPSIHVPLLSSMSFGEHVRVFACVCLAMYMFLLVCVCVCLCVHACVYLLVLLGTVRMCKLCVRYVS